MEVDEIRRVRLDKLKKLIDSAPEKGANKDEMRADRQAIQEEIPW